MEGDIEVRAIHSKAWLYGTGLGVDPTTWVLVDQDGNLYVRSGEGPDVAIPREQAGKLVNTIRDVLHTGLRYYGMRGWTEKEIDKACNR